jgi:hypothetical protein
MEIAKLTVAKINHMRNAQTPNSNVQVRFSAIDSGDYYFIIEDRRHYETQGYSLSHFVFFLEDDNELPAIHTAHSTMVQAMIQLAERFALDNCDTADATDDLVCSLHDQYRAGLRSIVE